MLTGIPRQQKKEILGSWKVGFKTIIGHLVTALLSRLAFEAVWKKQPELLPGVDY